MLPPVAAVTAFSRRRSSDRRMGASIGRPAGRPWAPINARTAGTEFKRLPNVPIDHPISVLTVRRAAFAQTLSPIRAGPSQHGRRNAHRSKEMSVRVADGQLVRAVPGWRRAVDKTQGAPHIATPSGPHPSETQFSAMRSARSNLFGVSMCDPSPGFHNR